MAITTNYNVMVGQDTYWRNLTIKLIDSVVIPHGSNTESETITVIGSDFSLHTVIESGITPNVDVSYSMDNSGVDANFIDLFTQVYGVTWNQDLDFYTEISLLRNTPLQGGITGSTLSSITLMPSARKKFKVTNNHATNSVTVSVYLTLQPPTPN